MRKIGSDPLCGEARGGGGGGGQPSRADFMT